MTELEFKGIFSRFENLNLLILMEDLRRGMVSRTFWVQPETKNMCPIAHGSKGRLKESLSIEELRLNPDASLATTNCELANIPLHIGEKFYRLWDDVDDDNNPLMADRELLAILTDIYNERLADADVVQGVCAAQPEPQPA